MYKTMSEVNPRNKNYSILLENFISEKIEIENKCFDCGCRNPELISINNGILICKNCGINHKSFPIGTSILINNNKNSLTEKELKFLKFGGNKALYEFILLLCPNLINFPRKYLYTSPLLYYYRKRLNDLVENDNNYSKNKMEKFSDRLNYLEINYSNYKNNSSTGSTFINSTNYRPNTINYDAINNKNAELRNNKFKNYYKKENYEEESNNHLLTQKKIDSKKSFIVYNKPKLKNRFNKINSLKKENNEESKSSRTEKKVIYSNDFDNIQNNKRNKNDNIRKSMPLNKYGGSSNTLTVDKYSSKTLIRSSKNNFISDNHNYKQISNYQKKISNDSKNNKGGKRIKEIIINKNIYKDYSINTRKYFDQIMPFQVNTSLQNTIDSSRYNNCKLNNNYISDFNLNETPTIIIHNSNKEEKNKDNNSQSVKTTERKKKYNINTIEIKFNKNKNEREKENKKMIRTLSEKKIKTININFIKNTKNEILNNEKKEKQKEHLHKIKEKTIEPIKKENVEQFQILPIKIFKKIYPKKLNNTKLEIDKNLLNKKIINKNRKMISPKREINYNKSKSLIKNESTDYNSNHLSNSYKKIRTFKFEETFKNSIRNKYKREKILQIK